MTRVSPIARISFGLACLTVSIVLIGDLVVGMSASQDVPALQSRAKLAETLAVNYSSLAEKDDQVTIQSLTRAIVHRNPEVLSASLSTADGRVIAQAGDHQLHWEKPRDDKSTPTHAQVPIFDGARRWGTVEISFKPLGGSGLAELAADPFVHFVAFVALSALVGYAFYMRRTLRFLNPAAVIPTRVRAAMDILSEGVVLVDGDEQIVLANDSFAALLDCQADKLLGRKLSEFDWRPADSEAPATGFPWDEVLDDSESQVLEDGESRTGVSLVMRREGHADRTFVVKGSQILDESGARRGALATFDDVTEVEKKNAELRVMLDELRRAQHEVARQNEKLHILATRDALTGCLNRRALFEKLEGDIEYAREHGEALSCIMFDIDHFKSFNDRFGHAVGDRVLQSVADTVRVRLRTIDVIGRYGGEEFCVVLRNAPLSQGAEVAERLRELLEEKASAGIQLPEDEKITASFGVAALTEDCPDVGELLDRADKALYESKNGGRNRVTCAPVGAAGAAAVA